MLCFARRIVCTILIFAATTAQAQQARIPQTRNGNYAPLNYLMDPSEGGPRFTNNGTIVGMTALFGSQTTRGNFTTYNVLPEEEGASDLGWRVAIERLASNPRRIARFVYRHASAGMLEARVANFNGDQIENVTICEQDHVAESATPFRCWVADSAACAELKQKTGISNLETLLAKLKDCSDITAKVENAFLPNSEARRQLIADTGTYLQTNPGGVFAPRDEIRRTTSSGPRFGAERHWNQSHLFTAVSVCRAIELSQGPQSGTRPFPETAAPSSQRGGT